MYSNIGNVHPAKPVVPQNEGLPKPPQDMCEREEVENALLILVNIGDHAH
jgi:hypothetical protein